MVEIRQLQVRKALIATKRKVAVAELKLFETETKVK